MKFFFMHGLFLKSSTMSELQAETIWRPGEPSDLYGTGKPYITPPQEDNEITILIIIRIFYMYKINIF